MAQVSKDSPAQKADLREGDVIVAYGGEPVKDIGGFRNRVSLTPPGRMEQLTIFRDGKRKILSVTIGKLSQDKLTVQGPAQRVKEIGLTVQTLTPQLAEQFDAEPGEGVVVIQVRPGSIAARAGIEPGSVILQVNRKAVQSAVEFQRVVEESRRGKRVLLLIRQGGMQRYVTLGW